MRLKASNRIDYPYLHWNRRFESCHLKRSYFERLLVYQTYFEAAKHV